MINGGFTIDGVAAKDLGIIMIGTSQRPVLPPTIDRTLGIPGRNGAWDFGADVGPRPLNLDCALIEHTALNLQLATERIADTLLDGYGKPKSLRLVFDLRPDRYCTVRYSGSLEIDRVVGFGRFALSFVAFDPAAYAAADAYDQPPGTYNTGLQYDSGLSYPNTSGFTWAGVYQMAGLYNYSKYVTPLKVTITGTVLNPRVKHYQSGKETAIAKSLTPADGALVIDSGAYTVKLGAGNGMSYMSGEYIELVPGDNGLIFSCGGTSANATVSLEWQHKYL